MTNNKIPKICMVVERFYPQVGGSETQALNLSEKLQFMGVTLFVLTRRTLKDMPPIETIRGVQVYRVLPTGTGITSLLLASASFALFLFKHRRDYDIIHCHGMGWAGPVSSLIGILLSKKVIVKIATAGDVTGRITGKGTIPAPINFIRLQFLKRVTNLICISSEIADELHNKGFDEDMLIRIPNGVDTERFSPGDGTRRLLPTGRLNIIFSGRLVYRKGIDVLFKAFRNILMDCHCPDVHLNILGSSKLQTGDQYERGLRDYVKENQLEGAITFHGDVDNVEEYLREADIFAFPSRHEGLPNALLEAMACGLPVVATSIGGIVDVIRDGENGILVKPDDVAGFYLALKRLIDSPETRRSLGTAARDTAEKDYSMEAIAIRYEKLYNILGKGI